MSTTKDSKPEHAIGPERAAAILAAYGASPGRWPSAERSGLARLLAAGEDLHVSQTEAAGLDEMLDTVPAFGVPYALERRVMADFDRVAAQRARSPMRFVRGLLEHLRDAVWPGVPLWQPASVLALSLAIGLAMGSVVQIELPYVRQASDESYAVPAEPPSAIDLDPAS